MYKLSEKENLMRILDGQEPEFLPKYDFWGWGCGLPMQTGKKSPDGYMLDEFGVELTTTEASMGGFMPVPGRIFLDDITKWRDVVKAPDVSEMDFERLAAEALKDKDWEHNPVILHNGGYFMTLMNMMGFADGLMAMIEEPEEVYALFEYLNEYYMEKEKGLLKYFHGDVYELADDTAANDFPFISRDVYRELVMPFAKKEADLARDAGLKIGMHDCGKAGCFIDDWLEMGVCIWEPAQTSNDILGIKEKYQGKLTIAGGWDNQGPISYPDTPDEELEQGLKDYIDAMAPNGGFCYMAVVVGSAGEETFDRKMKLVDRVYQEYGRDWYSRH
ncbi:MAG: veratrol--corrinoid protein metyltransferase [Eubacterium sp.]|nr:veratrol--corrinoid protein metyltransferase [Eubacterium sp.]MBR3276507.1 veratrol--corrinoid protein metyltransferase [Eubacterium sp.]